MRTRLVSWHASPSVGHVSQWAKQVSRSPAIDEATPPAWTAVARVEWANPRSRVLRFEATVSWGRRGMMIRRVARFALIVGSLVGAAITTHHAAAQDARGSDAYICAHGDSQDDTVIQA